MAELVLKIDVDNASGNQKLDQTKVKLKETATAAQGLGSPGAEAFNKQLG